MKTLEAFFRLIAGLFLVVAVWAVGTVVLTMLGIAVLWPFVDFSGPLEGGVNFAPIDTVAPYAAWGMAIYMAICATAAIVFNGREPD